MQTLFKVTFKNFRGEKTEDIYVFHNKRQAELRRESLRGGRRSNIRNKTIKAQP